MIPRSLFFLDTSLSSSCTSRRPQTSVVSLILLFSSDSSLSNGVATATTGPPSASICTKEPSVARQILSQCSLADALEPHSTVLMTISRLSASLQVSGYLTSSG